jgi:elongation factor Ts
MAVITAELVKQLRDLTDAGMMDCKRALAEANGDKDKAVEILRKSGIAKAEKKAARTVKEGKVFAMVKDGVGVMVEVLCETDFAAKNERFQAFVPAAAERIAGYAEIGDVSALAQEREKDVLTAMIATIGENMQLRRAVRWISADGACACYLHMGGRIGVMIEAAGKIDDVRALTDVCMHIAAFRPGYIVPADIPADLVASEKAIAVDQVKGKPAEIVEKIVQGKLAKWHTEICLMKQPWLRDDKMSTEKANPGLTVRRFVRWEMGEAL